jgi:hypothetical protein
MKSDASTPKEYLDSLPADRKKAVGDLRKVILKNLPKGFKEEMSYGMLGYVVPHTLYPAGYHCNPKLPLPFINLASQKNHIALYHMALYLDKDLLKWFKDEYSRQNKTKMDEGKGCLRFKKAEDIPLKLIGELVAKINPQEWISIYEKKIKSK